MSKKIWRKMQLIICEQNMWKTENGKNVSYNSFALSPRYVLMEK